jgi:hypothetical protein
MVYDGHRFKVPDTHSTQNIFTLKKGGDLNDEGGVDRQHREGGQDLKSISRKSH